MFNPIADWATGFPSVINNIEVLKDRKKRRTIGRAIIAMEQKIYDLKENAISVKSELEDLICRLREQKDFYLFHFCSLLEMQIRIMNEIQEILYGKYSYDSIMRIYGYDRRILSSLIEGKLTLVDLMRASVSSQNQEIPMTFDLSAYATVYQDENGNRHLYYPIALFEEMHKGKMKFTSKNRKKLLEHLSFLYDQVVEFDSVNKLEEAQRKLDEIIKNNFSIEDIVGERND